MSHQACNFIKKRLQHRCFPVSIVKCLREPYLKNICERLFLSCAEAYLGLYIQPFNIFAKNLIVVWKGFHSSTVNCSPATLFRWIFSKAAIFENTFEWLHLNNHPHQSFHHLIYTQLKQLPHLMKQLAHPMKQLAHLMKQLAHLMIFFEKRLFLCCKKVSASWFVFLFPNAHSESSQTSKIELFAKIVNGWKPLKKFTLDASLRSEYTSELKKELLKHFFTTVLSRKPTRYLEKISIFWKW